jgi:hypothetical protein
MEVIKHRDQLRGGGTKGVDAPLFTTAAGKGGGFSI